MRSFISKGLICVKDSFHLIYNVCTITYEEREDETFKYIFEPNYSVIDLLTCKYFQGIPGLNLDLRRKEYIRDNIIPTFISERVPQKNRVDYYELLEDVNLEYMDPIEYLIRTKLQYFGDNFFCISYKDKKLDDFNNFTFFDNNNSFIKKILLSICIGNDVSFNGEIINDSNRKFAYDILIGIYSRSKEANKQAQVNGINRAKNDLKYKGRKPVPVNAAKFLELLDRVQKKKMTPKEAASSLGISIDKYYRLRKKLRK